MTPKVGGSLLLLAAFGCSSPQEVSSEAAAPRPSASVARQTPSAVIPGEVQGTSPQPAPRPKARAKVVHLEIQAPEPRLYAAAILRVVPTVQMCVERAAAAQSNAGWVVMRGTLTTSGKLTSFELDTSDITTSSPTCIADAFGAVSVQHAPPKDAAVSIWISVAGPEPEGLDLLGPEEELLRAEDGLCAGREVFDCKPKKMCLAPRERSVACPELHGLPPQAQLKDADRRLDLGVSGGKTGQGSERLLLYAAKTQCAALKIKTDITGAQPKEERETVDIPCAALEKTLKLAEARLLGRRPRGDEKALHAVSKTVAYWKTGRDGVPIVTELRWAGPDPADDAFSLVSSEAAKAVVGRGSLALSRFAP